MKVKEHKDVAMKERCGGNKENGDRDEEDGGTGERVLGCVIG